MPAAPTPLYVRVSDVPAVYGMHRSTVYRWAENGLVTIYKRGSMSWVKTEEMSRAIEGAVGDRKADPRAESRKNTM